MWWCRWWWWRRGYGGSVDWRRQSSVTSLTDDSVDRPYVITGTQTHRPRWFSGDQRWTAINCSQPRPTHRGWTQLNPIQDRASTTALRLVGWCLTSLFSTNTAISETKWLCVEAIWKTVYGMITVRHSTTNELKWNSHKSMSGCYATMTSDSPIFKWLRRFINVLLTYLFTLVDNSLIASILPRDATLMRYKMRPCVCMSVCLSVTSQCCTKTA